MCYKSSVSGYVFAVAFRGWESLCLCPGCDSEHPEKCWGPVFCLLVRLVVGAPWLCEHPCNLSLMVYLHKSKSGEKYFCFHFLEFSESEEQSLPSLPLRNGSKKVMTEKDLYSTLLSPSPEHYGANHSHSWMFHYYCHSLPQGRM